MKKAALVLSLTALAAALPAHAAPRLSPQAQLDKALAGRVAGKPVDCIDPRMISDTQIIDKTAILYGSGRTIYLQVPQNARSLQRDDVLVTRLTGNGRLCSIDTVYLHEPSGLWRRGFVGLNKFVPYTRERVAAR